MPGWQGYCTFTLFHTDYCMIDLLFLLLLCAGTDPKPWHIYCVYYLSLLCHACYCLGYNPIVLCALLLSLGLLLYMGPYCILYINTGPCTPGDISSLWLCPSLHPSSHMLLYYSVLLFMQQHLHVICYKMTRNGDNTFLRHHWCKQDMDFINFLLLF
jgi:hypothetical protein